LIAQEYENKVKDDYLSGKTPWYDSEKTKEDFINAME
jgi:hypothetical protein